MTAPIGTLAGLRQAFVRTPAFSTGFRLTLLAALVSTAVQVAVPIAVQQIIDRQVLAPGGPDPAGVARLALAAIATVLVGVVTRRATIIRLGSAAARGLSDLRIRTFRHLHSLSILHAQAERRGSLVSRVTSDVSTIQDFMDWAGLGAITGGSQLLLALAAMFIYEWRLALIIVVAVILYGVLLWWFQRILRAAHDDVRRKVADSMSHLGEAISGNMVVRAYGAEDAATERTSNTFESQFQAEYRTARLGASEWCSATSRLGRCSHSCSSPICWSSRSRCWLR